MSPELAELLVKLSSDGHKNDKQLLDLSGGIIQQVVILTGVTTALLDRIEVLEERLDGLMALYMAQHAMPDRERMN